MMYLKALLGPQKCYSYWFESGRFGLFAWLILFKKKKKSVHYYNLSSKTKEISIKVNSSF